MKCVAYIVQDEGSTPLSELPGRAPIGAAAVPFLAVQRPDGTRTIFHPLWAPGDGNELERFELGLDMFERHGVIISAIPSLRCQRRRRRRRCCNSPPRLTSLKVVKIGHNFFKLF